MFSVRCNPSFVKISKLKCSVCILTPGLEHRHLRIGKLNNVPMLDAFSTVGERHCGVVEIKPQWRCIQIPGFNKHCQLWEGGTQPIQDGLPLCCILSVLSIYCHWSISPCPTFWHKVSSTIRTTIFTSSEVFRPYWNVPLDSFLGIVVNV